jgi:hypothetical protein
MWLRWLIVIPFAVACAAFAALMMLGIATVVSPDFAALVQGAFTLFFNLVWSQGMNGVDPTPAALAATTGLGLILAAILIVPAVITALVSEAFRIGSGMLQVSLAGVLTAALPLAIVGLNRLPTGGETRIAGGLFLIGAVAGAIYWLIAGRNAARTAAPASPSLPAR